MKSRARLTYHFPSDTNRRFLLFLLLLLLALLAVSIAACTRSSGATWERIQEEGTLRVGLDPTYPPFENAEGGTLQGFDVDLARALAAELDLEPHFTHIAYDGLYDALATEQVDVLISALVIRPDQMDDFAYSDPYFNAGQVLLAPVREAGIKGMEDLSGHSVAVEVGSQGHYEATRWQRRIPDLTIEPYNTVDEALAAAAAGEVAAALVDGISGRLFLRSEEELRLAGPPVTVEPLALVVRIEDEQLLAQLNDSLAALEESKQLAEIQARWLDN